MSTLGALVLAFLILLVLLIISGGKLLFILLFLGLLGVIGLWIFYKDNFIST